TAHDPDLQSFPTRRSSDLGKENGDESTGVLRACAMTLVVVAEADEDAAAVGETLALLMRDHPSRAIVVRVRASEAQELEARVFRSEEHTSELQSRFDLVCR